MSLGKCSPDSSTMEMKRKPEPEPMSVSELWTWPYSPGPTLWGTRGCRRGGTRLCWSTSGADAAPPLGNWLPALREGQLNSSTPVGQPCLRSQRNPVCHLPLFTEISAQRSLPGRSLHRSCSLKTRLRAKVCGPRDFCLTSPPSEPQWE